MLHSMSSSEDDEDTVSLASSVAELSQGNKPSVYLLHHYVYPHSCVDLIVALKKKVAIADT